MAQIPSTQGNPQASEIAVQDALNFLGSLSREDLQTVLNSVDSDFSKLFEDRNMMLTGGGDMTFDGVSLAFTEDIKLVMHQVADGTPPTEITLWATGASPISIAANNTIAYATVNRSAGTAAMTVTATASSIPDAKDNREIFLIWKRIDEGTGLKRLYWRNGMTIDEGQTVKMGSSGSGEGGGNPLLETLKNTLVDSHYELVTPNTFLEDEDTLVDGSSTGAYSATTKQFEYSAGSQFLKTTDLLDSTEVNYDSDIFTQVDLTTFWGEGAVDTAATYEVSRGGDVAANYQTITMERVGNSPTYHGTLKFVEETPVAQHTNDTTGTYNEFNTSDFSAAAAKFTLSDPTVITQFSFDTDKNGTPVGNVSLALYTHASGSDTPDVLVASTGLIPVSSLVTGGASNDIAFPSTAVSADTYWLVIETDQEYKDSFVISTTGLKWEGVATGGGGGNGGKRNASDIWTTHDTRNFSMKASGYLNDMRVKITSSAGSVALDGYGLFYDFNEMGIAGGIKNFDRKDFLSNTDNDDTFTINFTPDPELLQVHYVQTGQVFKYPAFNIDGTTISFDANTFQQATDQSVTLLFVQTEGSSFDNSDSNAGLLGANHLGSIDGSLDKSSAGRGIVLRNASGDLREIALDENDNLTISSLP